jgi:hypothetical protein
MTLLRKAWDSYPNDHQTILRPIAREEAFWARPESYDYAKGSVVPDAASTRVAPWFGLDDIVLTTFSSAGRLNSTAIRLVDAAARRESLDELSDEVDAALGRQPRWLAGKAILGMIRARQGRVGEAGRVIDGLLADPAAKPPYAALIVVGQELTGDPALGSTALVVFERAIKDDLAWSYSTVNFQGSAVRHLADLYLRNGRAAEARAVVLKTVSQYKTMSGAAASPSVGYRKFNGLNAAGAFLLDMGDPADALRAYQEVLGAAEEISEIQAYYSRAMASQPAAASRSVIKPESLLPQARAGVEKALYGLNRETAGPTIRALLKPGGGDKDEPPDLLMVVYPLESDKAAVTSLFTSALDLAVKDPALMAEVKAGVDAAVKERPGNLAAETAAALVACAEGDPEAAVEAARRLARLAEASPLEPLPARSRANARQRAEAARRLGFWLVARASLKYEAAREAGDRLAAQALDAARRQSDAIWSLAMLRESGRQALDRGDRVSAESQWAAALDLVLAQQPTAPEASARPPASRAKVRAPVLTLERFRQAAGLARLAAENGMADLSLRAVRGSLQGGPPASSASAPAVRALVRATAAMTPPDPTAKQVEAELETLDGLWRRQKVSPAAVYETLRDVVLPAARPTEIFLYDSAVETTASADPAAPPSQCVARLLARAAVTAGRADDLRKRVAECQGLAAAKLHARALLSLLAEAEKGE